MLWQQSFVKTRWPHVRWLDADTVLVVDRIEAVREDLVENERACAATMSRARLREFAGGRAVARRALECLEHSPYTGIPMGAAGEPVWPQGISGSLSHTTTHAAVLVARSTLHASVGIDLDDQRLLGGVAASELMTDDEIEAVFAQGWTGDLAIAQNLVFLAKESVFKYQYPLIGRRELDFHEVRLRTSERRGVLAASSAVEDPALQHVVGSARIFHEEIQGLRLCWALPSVVSST